MSVARGTGRWQTRWVTIESNSLSIFKNKRATQAKHFKPLTPGSCRVIVPIIESNSSYFSFQLAPSPDPKAGGKVKGEVFNFRTESRADRKRWVNLVRVRVMDDWLQSRYERFA